MQIPLCEGLGPLCGSLAGALLAPLSSNCSGGDGVMMIHPAFLGRPGTAQGGLSRTQPPRTKPCFLLTAVVCNFVFFHKLFRRIILNPLTRV